MSHGYRTFAPPNSATVSLAPLFTILLLFCPVATKSEQSHSSECVEVICPLEESGTALQLLDKADLGADKTCEQCDQCTRNGYSVCVQPVKFNSPIISSSFSSGCECAHSGPNVRIVDEKTAKMSNKSQSVFECRLAISKGRTKSGPKLNSGEGQFRFCFSSALRKLSKPEAKHSKVGKDNKPDLLVTVQQFWLSDYWKALKPSELTLFYVFPVAKKENCEGKATVPSADDMLWINAGKSKEEVDKQTSFSLCISSLLIHTVDEESANFGAMEEEGSLGAERHFSGGEEEEEEKDVPPEVIFEHNVFVGAEKVRLFYEVTVHRENLLKSMIAGKVKFESRKTKVSSEPLDFDLSVEQFKQQQQQQQMNSSSSSGQRSTPSATKDQKGRLQPSRVDRLGGIEQRKMPFKSSPASKEVPTTPLHVDASTAVPAPPGAMPTFRSFSPSEKQRQHPNSAEPFSPTLLPIPSSSSVISPQNGEEIQRLINDDQPTDGREDAVDDEDWQLLRTVLLISLLVIAVLFALALCYKKGFCCFGRSSPGDRSAKSRNINGKEYKETAQRLN